MFKNIKSLFIIEEEEAPKKDTPKVEQKESATTITRTQTSASGGQVVEKFTTILFGAMDANNIQGFDYLEFKHALKSLNNVQMDERTRYQSAAAMAKTMGVEMPYIIKTAEHYLDVLAKEEVKFGQTLATQRQQRIGNKEQETEKIHHAIKAKKQQIVALQKEIEQLEKQVQGVQKTIAEATVKITQTGDDFKASYKDVRQQILNDITKIKEYLG